MEWIETSLSRVDGEGGELWLRGVPVSELAVAGRLGEVMGLLWEARRDHTEAWERALAVGTFRDTTNGTSPDRSATRCRSRLWALDYGARTSGSCGTTRENRTAVCV